MDSRYTELIDAVLQGHTIQVSIADTTEGSIRTSIWRELKRVRELEAELGIDTYQGMQISIKRKGSMFHVKLRQPRGSVTFQIVEDEDE